MDAFYCEPSPTLTGSYSSSRPTMDQLILLLRHYMSLRSSLPAHPSPFAASDPVKVHRDILRAILTATFDLVCPNAKKSSQQAQVDRETTLKLVMHTGLLDFLAQAVVDSLRWDNDADERSLEPMRRTSSLATSVLSNIIHDAGRSGSTPPSSPSPSSSSLNSFLAAPQSSFHSLLRQSVLTAFRSPILLEAFRSLANASSVWDRGLIMGAEEGAFLVELARACVLMVKPVMFLADEESQILSGRKMSSSLTHTLDMLIATLHLVSLARHVLSFFSPPPSSSSRSKRPSADAEALQRLLLSFYLTLAPHDAMHAQQRQLGELERELGISFE